MFGTLLGIEVSAPVGKLYVGYLCWELGSVGKEGLIGGNEEVLTGDRLLNKFYILTLVFGFSIELDALGDGMLSIF